MAKLRNIQNETKPATPKKRKPVAYTNQLETKQKLPKLPKPNATIEVKTIFKLENNKVDKEPSLSTQELAKRYPIFKNEELIKEFSSVTMTNNQKGRIRQQLRDTLKGTSEELLPDVIHSRIQAIFRGAAKLTDPELRKVRILYNMLKTAIKTEKVSTKPKKDKDKKVKKPKEKDSTVVTEVIKKEKVEDTKDVKNVMAKNEKPMKVKGPKRYVVFLGNLPLDIDKERVMQHFSEFSDHIADVRIPKREGKKSSIAYMELKNEPSFELALSKHHSMLGNKRINVLYTTQKNGKITKTEAKSKSAKLIALQKSGKLMGSIPANRKRSHRRLKAKQAQARLEASSAH